MTVRIPVRDLRSGDHVVGAGGPDFDVATEQHQGRVQIADTTGDTQSFALNPTVVVERDDDAGSDGETGGSHPGSD
jgi:hypothetical protein